MHIPTLLSPELKEFIYGKTNILGDLANQDWRDILALMKRNCCATSIRMTVLFVGTSLPNLNKP